MKKNEILLLAFVCLLGVSCSANNEQRDSLPNIVLILVDDLGFGDISCNNPDSKISTPNIDKLASQGVRFIDGHTSAAQCSPTRYGLLTGRYSWRTRLKQGVLPHFDEPLIENDRETIASLLKKKGYSTACVGKWHLGLGWQTIDGETLNPRSWDARQNLIIDYSKPLTISPNDFGFDYYFGINASNNMLPYCLIENNKVVEVPIKPKYPVFDTESGKGLVSPDYNSEKLERTIFNKAMVWLNKQLNEQADKPFFLYYPMTAIHRPCLPDDASNGKSEAGVRGDKVVEVDAIMGELMQWLDDKELAQNTLFIFTSDNGGRPGDPKRFIANLAKNRYGNKYNPAKLIEKDSLLLLESPQEKPEGSKDYHIYHHYASAQFKGYKSDVYEGGHRVPFIVRWPGVVAKGEVKGELVSTLDVFSTFAAITDSELSNNAGEDSYNLLPLLKGKNNGEMRPNLVHKAWRVNTQAIRVGDWKFIPFRNNGGIPLFPDVEEEGQLYNLKDDPSEKVNLYNKFPEKVKELRLELEKVVAGSGVEFE